jgi:hypothetical protein
MLTLATGVEDCKPTSSRHKDLVMWKVSQRQQIHNICELRHVKTWLMLPNHCGNYLQDGRTYTERRKAPE